MKITHIFTPKETINGAVQLTENNIADIHQWLIRSGLNPKLNTNGTLEEWTLDVQEVLTKGYPLTKKIKLGDWLVVSIEKDGNVPTEIRPIKASTAELLYDMAKIKQ